MFEYGLQVFNQQLCLLLGGHGFPNVWINYRSFNLLRSWHVLLNQHVIQSPRERLISQETHFWFSWSPAGSRFPARRASPSRPSCVRPGLIFCEAQPWYRLTKASSN
jgi:hypothetical protein